MPPVPLALQTPIHFPKTRECVIGGCACVVRAESQQVLGPRKITLLSPRPLIFLPNSVRNPRFGGSPRHLDPGYWPGAEHSRKTRSRSTPWARRLSDEILGEEATLPGLEERWSPSCGARIPGEPPQTPASRSGVGPRNERFQLALIFQKLPSLARQEFPRGPNHAERVAQD